MSIVHELVALRRVKHSCVTQLIEVFEEEKELIIIMELVEGEHMLGFLLKKKQLAIDQARRMFLAICLGTRAIHEKGMVHRDIKMENILIVGSGTGNPPCKLTDFGLAHFVDKTQSEDFKTIRNCGTPGYIAPELVLSNTYSFSYDYFSLGVVLYIMLTSCFPFAGKDQSEIVRKNVKCKLDFSSPKMIEIGADARFLISNLIVRNPANRLSIDRVISHRWLEGFSILDENRTSTQVVHRSNLSSDDLGDYKKSLKFGKMNTNTIKKKSMTRLFEYKTNGSSKQSEGKETFSESNFQCLVVQGSSVQVPAFRLTLSCFMGLVPKFLQEIWRRSLGSD